MRVGIAAILIFLSLMVQAQEQRVKENPMNGMMALDFYDVYNGFLAHYDSLFVTHDNGTTWNLSLNAPGQFSAIECATAQDVFATAVCYNGNFYDRKLFRSTDNGATWDSLIVRANTGQFQKISVKNNNQVALYDNAKDSFLLADFSNVITAHLIEQGGMINFLKFVSNDMAFALVSKKVDSVNHTGDIKLKRSTDGGITWTDIWTGYGRVNRISADFFDVNSGVLKMDSTAFSTSDGGVTWTSIPLPTSTAWSWGGNEVQMGHNGMAYLFHESQWLKLEQNNSITDITPDSISYIHPLCFVKIINDDNWFVAENLLSYGIYGANLWRKTELHHQPTNTVDVLAEEQFSIFPNPASDFIRIESKDKKDFSVKLISSNGQLIKFVQMNSGLFDISGLSSGIYFVRITQDGKTVSKKVLVE